MSGGAKTFRNHSGHIQANTETKDTVLPQVAEKIHHREVCQICWSRVRMCVKVLFVTIEFGVLFLLISNLESVS